MPPLLIACILLCTALGIFLGGMIENDKNDAKHQKFKIAIVGSTEDNYLSMGITALKTLDSTRFAIEIIQTDEQTAKSNLESGKIAAYVVIPKGFAQAALSGNIMKIKYYTTDSAVGVVSIFKDEVTKTISDILVDSQKGVYGLADSIRDNTTIKGVGNHMDYLALDYLSMILRRSEVYTVSTLGVTDGLSTAGYFLSGILTLFILLQGIVASGIFIRKDNSLCRVIRANGGGAFKQVTSEYLAYFILIALIVILIVTSVFLVISPGEIIPDIKWATFSDLPLLLLKLLPAVAVITSLQFLLFEISTALVSGVLLQFLVAISLGYISGCFYPIYFFPDIAQKISTFLPSGIARTHISNCISNNFNAESLLGCAIYIAIFMTITLLIRHLKVKGKE